MDEICEISLLLDFYGQLLTQKQYEALDLHYNSDYSLAEISQHMNISRQGVYDNIKHAKATLTKLEQRLKLVERFELQKKKTLELFELLDSIDCNGLSALDVDKFKAAQLKIIEITEG